MRIFMLAGAAAISFCCATPTFAAQFANQEQPAPVQVQANPPGEGTPAATPPDPQTAGSPVAPAMPADANYNAGPYKGALTPPPSQAMDKAYPLCTSRLQDSCINPSEAGTKSVAAAPMRRRIRRARHN
jgi:hypothetical protein